MFSDENNHMKASFKILPPKPMTLITDCDNVAGSCPFQPTFWSKTYAISSEGSKENIGSCLYQITWRQPMGCLA